MQKLALDNPLPLEFLFLVVQRRVPIPKNGSLPGWPIDQDNGKLAHRTGNGVQTREVHGLLLEVLK